ncbi:intercellular adhesion molecule 5 isoform X1 [Salvelinus namaycush]|uniref:Intercellular adhesion molecule 5 isoform X1 n=1 Tax=Salvelinus namaycush TaxID=8040 RepID=A0A8U0Q5A7_SALNM|nr:intercellular adhesion molecule 5 isoform X1 [Salvelinus namaycush]
MISLQRMLGLLMLMLLHGVNTFPLELNPPRVVVRYGDSVSVNCSTSSTDHEGMGWEATFGGTGLKQHVNVVTWTVDNLTDWTIEPKCYITSLSDQPSKVLPVILYKTPDSVSISVLSHSGPMVEGTEYQLQCDIQNIAPLQNLVVKWYKGNELLDNVTYSDVSKTPVDVSPTLMIIPSRDDDGAQYRCRAELDLGPEGPQPHPTVTSEPLNITVHYKPVIECPSQYSAVENSPLDRIPCTFNGNPPPNVVWYQEGRQVNASAPLARTDFGQYVITITNDIGSTSSTVHITVEYAPKFNCIDQYEVKENENHNLSVTCTVDGNPSSKITWLKAQQEVDIPQSLTRENRGEYTLVTNNTHGKATHKLVINVLYAPEFLLGNDTVVVRADSDVSLDCSAEGNPPPELRWTNNTAEGNANETTVGHLRTLYISRVTANATYNCTVTNRLGSITKQIHVLVDVPPQQHPTMFSTAPSTPGTMTTLPATVKPKVVTFPLELNPPRVVVRYGDSVSVNCSTSSTDHEGMGWEATFGGTSFEQDVNVVTWTVDNLTDWTIEPKCYITLNDGKQSSKVLPVILYKTPDSVSISVLSHSGPMVEGTEYQLQCDIQNIAPQQNLVVKWYKGNELLDNVTYSNVSKTPVDVSATLMISPSRDDDEAQYSCRAELGLGPEGPQPHPTVTSEPLNITVHYKPVIECPSQYSAVKENSPLDRIPCTFNGNPPPNVVWYQEGRQVNASAPLGRTDFGQYVITITNDIGSTSYTVHITVEYAPKFNCIDQYEVKENENHNLSVTCTVDGNPSSKIIWLKAQQEVDIPQSLTRENRGEYTLVTNNTHGKATHKLVINVLYAPEFLLGNDTVEVSAGSDVSLNCSAEGNPPPEMKWNDTAARSVKLSTEGRQRTVRITTAGIYICTATNIFGTVTRRTTVTIKGGSTIIFWVIALVFLVIALVVLKVFCMWKKRQGYYNFIPVNQSNVPLMPLSTTGVDNHDPEGYPTKV